MKVRKTASAISLGLLAFAGVQPSIAQSVADIRHSGGGSGSPPDTAVFADRGIEKPGLYETMPLSVGERLRIGGQWLIHLKLSAGLRGTGEVSLGADVLRPPDDPDQEMVRRGNSDAGLPGLFTIQQPNRPGCRQQRIAVHQGALAVENWPGASCHEASKAHMVNGGTRYGVQVDTTQWALLGVTQDSVTIHWWGDTADEADQTTPCMRGRNDPCFVVAQTGELWEWSPTVAPRRVEEEEEPPITNPFLDGVDYLASDVWDDSILKSPWFWGGVGGTGVLLCLLWLCQGDDVTGTVIINPSR